jgi:cation-transporting ATPase I
VGNGRAHIEVRGVHIPGRGPLTGQVESALERVEGVDWAEVNAVIGRVVVAFDGDAVDVDDLVGVVTAAEEAAGVGGERFPAGRPEHPWDVEALRRNLIAMAADVVGLGVSGFGQVLQRSPLPAELASVVSLFDTQPRLRRLLEANLGHPATDLGLALGNAMAQALSQGPLGLVVDGAHRVNLIGELWAERGIWRRREPELFGRRHRRRVEAVPAGSRPRPLPDGPIETYADRASLASLGAFGLATAVTADPRRSSTVLLAGLPKAAQQGREAFAATLGRVLAGRDAVVMDAGVLRRLDRIDTVLLDAEVVLTGRAALGEPVAVGDFETSELALRARRVFDPRDPERTQRDDGWALGTLASLGVGLPKGVRREARRLGAGPAAVLGITRAGVLVGLAGAVAELDPRAGGLADAVRAAQLTLVVAETRATGGVAQRLGAVRVLAGGPALAASVRQLQSDGHGVAVISAHGHAGLAAADCGIGLIIPGTVAPFGADLMCGPGLDAACFLAEACATARAVSRRSALIALAGSGVGGLWATLGPARGAANRALVPVNSAALAAQVGGTVAGVALARHPPAVPAPQPPWHAMGAAEVIAGVDSRLDGLGTGEAAGRREPTGPDAGTGTTSLAAAVVSELANPLTPVLAAGAVLSAAIGSVTDAALVGGVVIADAAVSGIQRWRTEGSLQRLLAAGAMTVAARRDGAVVEVSAAELVPGDIIELGPGEVVPADCRIIETAGCELDESTLTGESLPVRKGSAPIPDAAVAGRSCMLYEATTILTGTATAVVVATGAATEAGRALATAANPPPSGVEVRLRRLTALSLPVTLVSGAALTTVGVLRRRRLADAVGSGISLMVAAVPEGLPLLATVAQQAAAHRLSRRGALVRNPRTIEALGRVDVLCFDKTGTLTEGRIGLQRVSDGRRDQPVDALGPAERHVLAAALCASPPSGDGDLLPHATDEAIVGGSATAGVDVADYAGAWEPLADLAFEPARGFHAVLGRTPSGVRVVAKGAPEVVFPRCRSWRTAGGIRPLDRRARREVEAEVDRLARRGLRILAVAEAAAAPSAALADQDVCDLELVGLVALADLVRPTAAAAIDSVRRAGVAVSMVTGDHPRTAAAIAAELGIHNGGQVLGGPDMDALTDAQLDAALSATSVFARITPAQKVRIVEAYQRAGRVVAMAGDGANDAAAIRLADAGVALGRRGTATARQAADLVVTDDRLETIVDAIVEGRAMWASVRDALAILLGGNLGEVGFALAGAAFTGSSPLAPRQLLLVNLLTDMLPAMAIALRPPAGVRPEALLSEGPDASLGAALARDVAVRAAATAAGATAAWLFARTTGTATRARTVGLVALVGTQLGQTAAVGGRSPVVLAASAVSAGVLVAVVQTPVLSQFFGCTPLGPAGWATALGSVGMATGASIAVPWAAARLARRLPLSGPGAMRRSVAGSPGSLRAAPGPSAVTP